MKFQLSSIMAIVFQNLNLDLFKVEQLMEQVAMLLLDLHNARNVSKDYMDLLAVQTMQMIALIALVADMVIK